MRIQTINRTTGALAAFVPPAIASPDAVMREPRRSLSIGLALCAAWLAAPLASAAEERDSILETGSKRYSQHDEELVIRHFFDDRRGGFFVDVGSYLPRINNTTYYLEKHLGWSGIAIDALPGLDAAYRELRPATRFFQHIVTDHSGGTETLYVAGPLSSTDDEHLDRFAGVDHEARAIEVTTITLNDLLAQNGVERIDFLSIDIEGSEPAALAGFDIERFRPELVCIEASLHVREAIAAYFGAHGYERIEEYLGYDGINWYYTPRGSRSTDSVVALVAGLLCAAALGALLWRRTRGPRAADSA